MNALEVVQLFRSQVHDEVTPYLWSDAEVYEYLDQAQKWLVRRLRGLPDATTPEITRIENIATGTLFVDLDPRILRIRGVFDKDNRELDVLNTENLGSYTRGDDYGKPSRLTLSEAPGKLRAVVTGMEQNKLRLVSPPDQEQEIRLLVNRLPMERVVEASTPMELEVDEQHHFFLIDGMKALAYRKEDAETFDRGRVDEFTAGFEDYAFRARMEQERLEHRPRTVVYRGL